VKKDPDPRVAAASATHELITECYPEYVNGEAQVLSTEKMVKFGQIIWEQTYKPHPFDDNAALHNLVDHLEAAGRFDPETALMAQTIRTVPYEQLTTLWAGRWVDQGCPRIVIEERYAAVLMSTDAKEDVADLVVAPWKAMLIELPQGLLSTVNPKTGGESPLRRLYAQQLVNHKGENVWDFLVEADDGLKLWRHGLTNRECLTLDVSEGAMDTWESASFAQPIETQDERVILLVGRLIISMCLAMSDPSNVREQKKTKGRGSSLRRFNKGGPEVRTFVLGKPMKVDCRQAVKDFIHSRRGGKLSVQFLVRGHWKNQPHGPAHSLRKLIQIEPYWKGPEDAKIVAKAMHLGS
jgi:hypothetical protein